MEVIGVATPDAFAQVQEAAPDVVIVETKKEEEQSRLVAQVLESIPGAKVVGLSLEDNRIHTYYQQMKQGRRVEDLLETIREPMNRHGRSPEALRLFVLYQGHYGQRILENVRRFGPQTWTVEAWRAPAALPPVVDDPSVFLPQDLPTADLVLSLCESPSGAQLMPSVVEITKAKAVIAPIDNIDWLPEGLMRQLGTQLEEMGVNTAFPKPFCSLTEESYSVQQETTEYQDPWIGEFARCFGQPAFRIACSNQQVTKVKVERDTACGCARDVAHQLIGVDTREATIQAGLFHHHYPCLATMRVDPKLGEPLIQVAGDFVRHAIEFEIASSLPEGACLPSGDK
jgi:hypothetical protein